VAQGGVEHRGWLMLDMPQLGLDDPASTRNLYHWVALHRQAS